MHKRESLDNQPDQSNLDLSSPNLSFYMLHELHHMNYNNHRPTAKENESKNKQINEQRCIQKLDVYWKRQTLISFNQNYQQKPDTMKDECYQFHFSPQCLTSLTLFDYHSSRNYLSLISSVTIINIPLPGNFHKSIKQNCHFNHLCLTRCM